MAAQAPRTLKTVTGAGGQGQDIYDQAIDQSRSTLDTARLIAERAEKAEIDFLFTADPLRFGAQGAIGSQEPLMFVSALSSVTSRIGLIATVSTTFHHPFNLARLFGTLDQTVTLTNESGGRAAEIWTGVASAGQEIRPVGRQHSRWLVEPHPRIRRLLRIPVRQRHQPVPDRFVHRRVPHPSARHQQRLPRLAAQRIGIRRLGACGTEPAGLGALARGASPRPG
jgi:alkanesulfonate monooxygenase SsuD/methylene tetrahydromethanopterin reductase-like flavin-dependent oxidoreductase (luciferase family)